MNSKKINGATTGKAGHGRSTSPEPLGERSAALRTLALVVTGFLCLLAAGCAFDLPPDEIDFDTDRDSMSNAVENDLNNRLKHTSLNPNSPNTNPTRASGDHKTGPLLGALNLPDTGRGYQHYRGLDAKDTDDWATMALINLVEAAGRGWAAFETPGGGRLPRLQPGDMSLEGGGEFCWVEPTGQEKCHAWHRNGTEVDARYVRFEGALAPLNVCESSSDHDQFSSEDLLNLFVETAPGIHAVARVDTIIVASCVSWITAPATDQVLVIDDSGVHNDHFHVLIRDPDGPNN